VSVADLLRRRADEYVAIAAEHATAAHDEQWLYAMIELALREMAAALDEAEAASDD